MTHVSKRASCSSECNDRLRSAEEDLGVKATGDAITVRIPKA